MHSMSRSVAVVFVVLLTVFSTAWSAFALPVLRARDSYDSRDVYDPKITSPKAGDVFKAGQTIVVAWDTSSLPAGLQNQGMLVLGRLTNSSENLDLDHILAEGFLLTDGSHTITLPRNATTAHNYILDLFGDSGNISPTFTIHSHSH